MTAQRAFHGSCWWVTPQSIFRLPSPSVGGGGSKQQYIFGLGADIEGVDDVDDAERSAVEDVDGTQVSMMSMVLWAASHNRIIFLRDEFLSRRSGRYTRMTATRRASRVPGDIYAGG